MVNHRALTAAMIDSRGLPRRQARAETEVLLPAGPKVAFTAVSTSTTTARSGTGSTRFTPSIRHGAAPRRQPEGAERIAAAWANARKVTQIAFKARLDPPCQGAPFRRNDQMLAVMPIGVIVFRAPASPQPRRQAKKLGIPVWKLTAAHERRLHILFAMSRIRRCGSLPCPDRGISSGLRLIANRNKRTLKFDFASALSDEISCRPVRRSIATAASPGPCSPDGVADR